MRRRVAADGQGQEGSGTHESVTRPPYSTEALTERGDTQDLDYAAPLLFLLYRYGLRRLGELFTPSVLPTSHDPPSIPKIGRFGSGNPRSERI